MAGRTIVIGDIHGDLAALNKLFGKLPTLDRQDTLVFVGDYIDRGLQSAQVIEFVRKRLPAITRARVVALRGNHEDAWLRVASGGWPEFVLPESNGCLATLRSYKEKLYFDGDRPTKDEYDEMLLASFFPEDDLEWMSNLPYWYEDDHAIYVHAGLTKDGRRWLHPSEVANKSIVLWVRTMDFFQNYRGKRVVCGHTSTDYLPPELSSHTPEDPTDMWAGEAVLVIDTGCGKGGFLTAVELPSVKVYESRG